MKAVGQQAPELAARAGFSVPPTTKILLAPLPADLALLGEHPLVQEKLMPVLGRVRARSAQHGIAAAVLVTEHGGLGHTAAIYANDDDVVTAYGLAVRTGRILVNAPTAVGQERGVVDQMRSKLRTSHVQVFSEVQPEPDEATIRRGVALLERAQPDLVVAVGGGSVIDAAKAMRLSYEHPEKNLEDLTLPFLDPRKRVADYPRDAHTVQLVAVPTTSGTGSEVSPAAVLTVGDRKETLVDYCLVPEVAIVDPLLTLSMSPSVTVDSGIDALTHALDAAVSIFASLYTDAYCVQSARLIFDALPKVFDDPGDLGARTDMANAATLAGLAFANAFVGTNHALAHAVGATFGIAHGRANVVFLPHVLRYNAGLPSKFMPAPGYSAYIAPDKYAQLGRVVFGGREPEESRRRLFQGVAELLDRLQMPRTLKAVGVAEDEFLEALPELAMNAL